MEKMNNEKGKRNTDNEVEKERQEITRRRRSKTIERGRKGENE